MATGRRNASHAAGGGLHQLHIERATADPNGFTGYNPIAPHGNAHLSSHTIRAHRRAIFNAQPHRYAHGHSHKYAHLYPNTTPDTNRYAHSPT